MECCSGLLFYGLMQRAIKLKKREPGSAPAGCNAEDFFTSSDDSVLVCRLWETTLGSGAVDEKAAAIKNSVGAEAFKELQEIASLLMRRLQITLANAIIATAVKLNRDRGFSKYHVIFEGSVALNPNSFPRILAEVRKRLENKALFDAFGAPVPVLDLIQRPQRKIIYDASIGPDVMRKMEISLIGTAVLGITDAVLNNVR